MKELPIDTVLPELCRQLSGATGAVLTAQPGAGKTTRVPLALLNEAWLAGKKILMLEPRRLAARSAARYMAALLGEKPGESVGYRVRHEACVSANTRIEVITEGILTRCLQHDPLLEDVGAVIFDEFHERSIHADLGLALCLQAQQLLGSEVKILVMSATLDTAPIAALLGNVPVIESPGRVFPVETRYVSQTVSGPIAAAIAGKVHSALRETTGDILVFLPGAREIHQVARLLEESSLAGAMVVKLYGGLTAAEQDAAIVPDRAGRRKIVLSTAIAETSITVEGVRVVIDSGLMRIPRFSPRTGMTHLETVQEARSSADQRRGRAGRLDSGVCYRLFTKEEEQNLMPQRPPEIMEADLAQLVLELAVWGAKAQELAWLNPPPPGAVAQAEELLQQLGALTPAATITSHGRKIATAGLHPRLAHMILKAGQAGYGRLAAELAAILEEGDILTGEEARRDADIRLRLNALRQGRGADMGAVRRARENARQWQRQLKAAGGDDSMEACGLVLAWAYPDRMAQNKGSQFVLRNGRGAVLGTEQLLSQEEYIVAAELGGESRSQQRIFLAAPLALETLRQHFSAEILREEQVLWDKEAQAVRARYSETLGALILQTGPLAKPAGEALLAALVEGIRREGLDILPWSKAARQYRQRLAFMHTCQTGWPAVDDGALLATLEEWLAPYLLDISSRSQLEKIALLPALEGLLAWPQRQQLESWAPTHITVPSGQRIAINYEQPQQPMLAVRLQEVFGLLETPRLGQDKVPLTLQLLSPAQRPVQITRDLASFWREGYFAVKKDLQGRYPKHYWPEDPLTATATNRVKARMNL